MNISKCFALISSLPKRFSNAYGFDLTAVFITSSTMVCSGLLGLNVVLHQTKSKHNPFQMIQFDILNLFRQLGTSHWQHG